MRARRRSIPPALSQFISTGRGAELLAFGLEHVVEAPLGKLDTGGEPQIPGLLHVLDDAAERQRAPGPADDVGVHGERDVFRAFRAALRIELVEIGLPGLEPVIRVAVFSMAVAEQRTVAERLPRQLDQD